MSGDASRAGPHRRISPEHRGTHLPALANLCAYRLDFRLAGLGDAFGAVYSRYADDLAFSGGTPVLSRAPALHREVAAIDWSRE